MAILACIAIGIMVATTGAWKDTVWEPFKWRTFFKSPVAITGWGIILTVIFPSEKWFFIALSATALERLSVEIWKGVFRKMPSKFKNPNKDTTWLLKRIRLF